MIIGIIIILVVLIITYGLEAYFKYRYKNPGD